MDGQLTLLGEVLEGAASGYRSCVLVAVGTGIGGALMIEGRIWRGHHGGAGAWGWLPAGEPDLPTVIDALAGLDKPLYCICEEDMYPCDPSYPLPNAIRTREFLAEHGLGRL